MSFSVEASTLSELCKHLNVNTHILAKDNRSLLFTCSECLLGKSINDNVQYKVNILLFSDMLLIYEPIENDLNDNLNEELNDLIYKETGQEKPKISGFLARTSSTLFKFGKSGSSARSRANTGMSNVSGATGFSLSPRKLKIGTILNRFGTLTRPKAKSPASPNTSFTASNKMVVVVPLMGSQLRCSQENSEVVITHFGEDVYNTSLATKFSQVLKSGKINDDLFKTSGYSFTYSLAICPSLFVEFTKKLMESISFQNDLIKTLKAEKIVQYNAINSIQQPVADTTNNQCKDHVEAIETESQSDVVSNNSSRTKRKAFSRTLSFTISSPKKMRMKSPSSASHYSNTTVTSSKTKDSHPQKGFFFGSPKAKPEYNSELVKQMEISSPLIPDSTENALVENKSFALTPAKVLTPSNQEQFGGSPEFIEKKLQELSLNSAAKYENRVKEDSVFMKMIACYSISDTSVQTRDIQSVSFTRCIKILEEVLTSEKEYVFDLCSIVNEYMRPLKLAVETDPLLNNVKATTKIKTRDIDLIFGNIESLVDVNTELYKALVQGIVKLVSPETGETLETEPEKRVPTIEEVSIMFAEVFKRHMPFLKLYSLYCHQYRTSLVKLDQLRNTNAPFESIIKQCDARSKSRSGGLQNLLIKPVQRICKYPLLFRELLRCLKELKLDSSVEVISKALDQVEVIAASVNQKVQDIENQEQMLEVFRELGGSTTNSMAKTDSSLSNLLTPTRRFMDSYEILLREVGADAKMTNTKRLPCILYLFNDALIIGKCVGNTFWGMSNFKHLAFSTLTNAANENNMHAIGHYGSASESASTTSKTKSSSESSKQRAKLSHMFSFLEDTIKVLRSRTTILYDENRRCALELLVSSTRRTVPATSIPGHSQNQFQPVVYKFEIWCENKIVRDNLAHQVTDAVEAAAANRRRRISQTISANRLSLGSPDGNVIEVTSRIETEVKQSQGEKDSEPEFVDALSSSFSNQFFQCTFYDGMIGLAVRSAKPPLVGVAVGDIAKGSQAEKLGVQLGDLIVAVGSTFLPSKSSDWQEAFTLISTSARPMTIKFKRVLAL